VLSNKGYAVITAANAHEALTKLKEGGFDAVFTDIRMPGMDGFEVARRLKARPETAHIPIIFMTGLTDTEHVVRAFEVGGVDYVTKPIRAKEVLARMSVHVQGARQARQARNALDAFGHATLVVRAADGKVVWKTPLARDLLLQHFDGGELDDAVLAWVREELARRAVAGAVPGEPLKLSRQNRRLVLALHEQTGEDEWLIVMRESSDQAVIDAVGAAFRLTTREAEVLYWVAKGKISRDIADILSMSPATVKKHLEHIYEKLGVETRTAAAGLAMSRVRGLSG